MTDYRFCPSIEDARAVRDTSPEVAIAELRASLLQAAYLPSPSPAPLTPRASEAPTEPHDVASGSQSARADAAGGAS